MIPLKMQQLNHTNTLYAPEYISYTETLGGTIKNDTCTRLKFLKPKLKPIYEEFHYLCSIKLKKNLMFKISRKIELNKLLVLKDKNFIKVATGVRRAGKSTLLLQFQELLKA